MAETPREAVVRVLLALERECLAADRALVECRWPEVDASFAGQTKLTEELAQLFAAEPATAPERDAKVAQRLRGIINYRDDQLRRLKAYNATVGERLESMGKLRAFSRSIGSGGRARLLDQKY